MTVCHARPSKYSPYTLWVANILMQDACAKIEFRFISVATSQVVRAPIVKGGHVLAANRMTEILSRIIDYIHEEPLVLAARLLADEECISRDVDWPQKLEYLSFEKRGVIIDKRGVIIDKRGVISDAMEPGKYKVTVERPPKGLMLDDRDGIALSDNCIDLVPGDRQIIGCTGLKEEMGTSVPNYRYLGSDDHQ